MCQGLERSDRPVSNLPARANHAKTALSLWKLDSRCNSRARHGDGNPILTERFLCKYELGHCFSRNLSPKCLGDSSISTLGKASRLCRFALLAPVATPRTFQTTWRESLEGAQNVRPPLRFQPKLVRLENLLHLPRDHLLPSRKPRLLKRQSPPKLLSNHRAELWIASSQT